MTAVARTRIALIVAVTLICGWFLRVAVEKVPGWETVAVLVALIAFNALTEVLVRQIDRAIRKGLADG